MIYIIPDTNQLYVSLEKCSEKDVYNHFFASSLLVNLIDIRDHSNSRDNVEILIPEIVLRELIQQKYESYIADYTAYKALTQRFGISVLPGLKGKEEFVCDVKKQANEYFESVDIKIMPMCSPFYFSNIVDCAINKQPPFEGKTGKADKGFKDALLFYSMVQYASNHTGEYILLSSDKMFSSPESSKSLKNTFASRSNCQLRIFQSIEDLKANIVLQTAKILLGSISYIFETFKRSLNVSSTGIPINVYQKKPIFTGDAPIIRMLNNKIEQLYNTDINYWDNYKTQRVEYDQDMVYESSLEAEITKNSSGLLSMVLQDFKYLGGAHGGTRVSAYTYDINSGRQLSLTQVLQKDNKTLCQQINLCVNNDISSSKEDKYLVETVNITDSDSVVYYLKDKEVHIVFNEYELGPFSSGAIDLVLCEI